MASNHTQNYGLNQWQLSDNVVMADFNADNRKIDAALAATPRVQAGSYVGTGTFGKDAPTCLTFDFAPKMVYLRESSLLLTGVGKHFLWIPGAGSDSLDSSGTRRNYSLDGKTLSWYVNGYYASEWWQMNGADNTYYYVAIG